MPAGLPCLSREACGVTARQALRAAMWLARDAAQQIADLLDHIADRFAPIPPPLPWLDEAIEANGGQFPLDGKTYRVRPGGLTINGRTQDAEGMWVPADTAEPQK